MIPGIDSTLMLSSPAPPDPETHPSITLVWSDNNATEDRTCNSSSCPFTIKATISNPLGVTVTSKIQCSVGGSEWVDVSNLLTYSDEITDETKNYRAVVSTSNASYYSNILKYEKESVPQNITAKNVVSNNGQTAFDLVVEGTTFYGYIILSGTRDYNIKNVLITHYYNGNSKEFTVPNSTPFGTKAYSTATLVTIPVGTYSCQLNIFGYPILVDTHPSSATCEIIFSPTANHEDGILGLEAYRLIEID